MQLGVLGDTVGGTVRLPIAPLAALIRRRPLSAVLMVVTPPLIILRFPPVQAPVTVPPTQLTVLLVGTMSVSPKK